MTGGVVDYANAGYEEDRYGEECEHDWRWVSDWMGDPNVINGTQDLSHWECACCGAQSNRDRNDPPTAPRPR